MINDGLSVFISKCYAVGECHSRSIVSTYPQTVHFFLQRFQLLHQLKVTQFILRNRCRPNLHSYNLGFWSVGLQKHLTTPLVYLSNNLFVGQFCEAYVTRATNVIQQKIVIFRAAIWEERRRPQGSKSSYAL